MKFEDAMKQKITEGSFPKSEIRDRVKSFTAAGKKIKPMNPEFLEKFKSVKYDYKSSKDDPESWKHYKKFFQIIGAQPTGA